MSDENEGEETVVLTRRDRRRAAATEADAAQVQPPSDVDEDAVTSEVTVVVDRPARRLRRKRDVVDEKGGSGQGEIAEYRRVESFAPAEGPAPAIYKPRPAPLAPVAPPVIGAAAPTRIEDPALRSVAKQGRRWSLITLAVAASACVVSIAGLVALGFVVFG